MKKILLAFMLCIITSFVTQAQDAKPSKEATQKFLNNMVSQAVGKIEEEGSAKVIQRQFFDNDFSYYLYQTGLKRNGNVETFSIDEYKSIRWAEVTSLNKYPNGIITGIQIIFKSEIEQISSDPFMKTKSTNYTDILVIHVSTDKVESCLKALLRLSEIAKEENKDPFQN